MTVLTISRDNYLLSVEDKYKIIYLISLNDIQEQAHKLCIQIDISKNYIDT